jgi:NAD(P)-dependent dehydrogenase (short-subunit alcohol dehydrogenase family)
MNSTQRPEVVVVTGASAGLGRAIATEFAKQGAHIGLLARGREGLEGARRDVEAHGGRALILPTDVADPDQVERAAAAVEQEFGPIDVWVNNAMVSVFSPVKEMTPADYKRVTEVTYLGFVHGTLAALRRMLPRDRGIIVQVGSALAYRSIPLQSAYCAAKHAISGFTDSLRCELIHDGSNVKVTMVQMPTMNTPQFDWVKSRLPRKPQPVPPIYQPEVGAEAVVWAAHHYRREWFVGSSTVVAIQGNKVAPALGDWYLGRQGYGAQQYDGPVGPDRPNNLYEPVDNDRDIGAHGDFDNRARAFSYQVWADQHRDWLTLAGAGLAGALYDALGNGAGKFWRGGLIGASLAALGVLGFKALTEGGLTQAGSQASGVAGAESAEPRLARRGFADSAPATRTVGAATGTRR